MVHFFIKIMGEFMRVSGSKIKCMEQVILYIFYFRNTILCIR